MPAPQSSQFAPNTVFDSLFSFELGMNAGKDPLLLPKNQLAFASNLSVRGNFANTRPPRMRYALNFGGNSALQTAFSTGLFQGYCYYQPDSGVATVMVSISGRLYQLTPNPATLTATVADVTGGNPQSATAVQCWLIQAENYVFWNDGINPPVFFNGTTLTTARSIGQTNPNPIEVVSIGAILTTPFQTQSITLTGNYPGPNGSTVVLNPGNNAALSGLVISGTGTPVINVQWNNPGSFGIFATNQLQQAATPQFPVGRQMAYGRGRVWMALADGVSFLAGDIVGGPSGTKALNFRDAILNITENQYLTGGGTFRVPGSIGDIRAMIFGPQLDTSLGQGPLFIFTPAHVFSCNAPVDRLTWQSITNPILTETLIANGALGQYSTFIDNSDVLFRAVDGIRSLILARQDFDKWNNTPISHEVFPLLAIDNQALLPFSAGCFFDNRALMTTSPISTAQGVYHQALIAINTDLITTIRDKENPAYDGFWPGMNILGITTGQFSLVQRCFQFVYNTVQQTIEFWELLPSAAGDVENTPNPIIADNGTDAIQWWFISPSLFREPLEKRTFKKLINGEIYVDQLVGRVDFQTFYKPDRYPCWIPWLSWSECATQNTGAPTDNTKPQFRPRMGLGTPTAVPCDPSTNRPLDLGYTYQIKIVFTGQCEFIGARFAATIQPEPTFAEPQCVPIC